MWAAKTPPIWSPQKEVLCNLSLILFLPSAHHPPNAMMSLSSASGQSDSSSVVYQHEPFLTFAKRILDLAATLWPHSEFCVERLPGGGFRRIIGLTRRTPAAGADDGETHLIVRMPRFESAKVDDEVATPPRATKCASCVSLQLTTRARAHKLLCSLYLRFLGSRPSSLHRVAIWFPTNSKGPTLVWASVPVATSQLVGGGSGKQLDDRQGAPDLNQFLGPEPPGRPYALPVTRNSRRGVDVGYEIRVYHRGDGLANRSLRYGVEACYGLRNIYTTALTTVMDRSSPGWGTPPKPWEGGAIVARSDRADLDIGWAIRVCRYCVEVLQPLFHRGPGGRDKTERRLEEGDPREIGRVSVESGKA
ncbi:hypothetical protein OQA88_3223 [Cercophora sp. LCS_1]